MKLHPMRILAAVCLAVAGVALLVFIARNNDAGQRDFISYWAAGQQLAHGADERYTVRDGINVARFAIKLKSLATQRTHETEALEIAITQVLGEEALRYVRSNRPSAT